MGKSYQWHNYIIEGLSPRHNVIQDKDDDGVKTNKEVKDKVGGCIDVHMACQLVWDISKGYSSRHSQQHELI